MEITLEKARYTYNTNFPKCPTPSELLARRR